MGQTYKYEYLKHEVNDWLLKLNLLKEENINLKERLPQIVAENTNTAILKEVEAMQSRMLNMDVAMQFLRKEIMEHKADVELIIQECLIPAVDIAGQHLKISGDIYKLSKQLSILKADFESYF